MCVPGDFYIIREVLCFGLSNITLFRVSLGLLGISFQSVLMGADGETGGVSILVGARARSHARLCVCLRLWRGRGGFMTLNNKMLRTI